MSCGHILAEPAAEDTDDGFTVKVKMANLGHYQTLISYTKGNDFVVNTDSTVKDGYQVFRGSVDGILKAGFVVRRPENNNRMRFHPT